MVIKKRPWRFQMMMMPKDKGKCLSKGFGPRATSLLLIVSIASFANAQDGHVRPGKGLSFIIGDFAEYSVTETNGDQKTSKPSMIMIALGPEGPYQAVQMIRLENGEPVDSQKLLYDLTKAKEETGELLDSGEETLTVDGKEYRCKWDKWRNGKETMTRWTCPDIRFERYARVKYGHEDGRSAVFELVLFGPSIPTTEKEEAFLKMLEDFRPPSKKKDK